MVLQGHNYAYLAIPAFFLAQCGTDLSRGRTISLRYHLSKCRDLLKSSDELIVWPRLYLVQMSSPSSQLVPSRYCVERRRPCTALRSSGA